MEAEKGGCHETGTGIFVAEDAEKAAKRPAGDASGRFLHLVAEARLPSVDNPHASIECFSS